MTYKTIKYIKSNPYLYEVRSVREGDRVRQVFVRYLGRADRADAIKRRTVVPEIISPEVVVVEPTVVIPEVAPEIVKEPWEMTKEEFEFNPPEGYKYNPALTSEAQNKRYFTDTGREGDIEVGDKFFNMLPEERRHTLIHEAGHDFAENFMKGDLFWQVSDSGIFGKGTTTPEGKPFYDGIMGTVRADEADRKSVV